jgi:hypothetical protein
MVKNKVTVRQKPCGPVMSDWNPPLNGSAAIHGSCGPETRFPPSTTAVSMRRTGLRTQTHS